jgi:hypothetical protein
MQLRGGQPTTVRFSVYHIPQVVKKVVPFAESCPGTHTGYRMFLSHGDFASRSTGFLCSIFIIILLNKSVFCNVGHFINAMTIRYVGQNMLEWNMGGNFNFIEQWLPFCARIHWTWVYDKMGNPTYQKSGLRPPVSLPITECSGVRAIPDNLIS